MNMARPFHVYAALPGLGFVGRESFGLTLAHPQCALDCSEVSMPPAGVWFNGYYNHGRSMGELDFKLPPAVESLDQLKALLAYNLHHAITEAVPRWLAEGRELNHLLPWVREHAAFAERDHCTVARNWLKLALRELQRTLPAQLPAGLVSFKFDGTVLQIVGATPIAMHAKGAPWRETYEVRAGDLASLPCRLMRDYIEVSAWEGYLTIANRRYPLAKVVSDVGAG